MSQLGPFPTPDAVARLLDKAPLLKIVGGAAGLATAIEAQPRNAPAAYVLTEERGGDVKYTGPIAIQNVSVNVQVVLFVRNATGEAAGAGAEAQMQQVETQVKQALFGWSPASDFDQLAFSAQRTENYQGSWLVRQLIFTTHYRMSQQVNA